MADNLHSTLVAWLKVILPLTALAILSTLFLVARTIDPEGAIPYADVDIADRLREPRLVAPRWAGVTDDGTSLTVTADEARPGSGAAPEPTALRLAARMEFPDAGGTADLTAAEGRLDAQAGRLFLSGGVVVDTSDGWRLEAPSLTAALDRTQVEAAGGVQADGPLGRLTAASMTIARRPGANGYDLRFAGGVKLVYLPAD